MSKAGLINEAKNAFLEHKQPDEKGCRLAEVYLETVKKYGAASLIHHSKLWKQNRAKKIKQSCETCGSKEGLHISHVWHPPKGHLMRWIVENKYSEQIEDWNKNFSPRHFDPTRDGCPSCGGKVFSFRKTTNDYRCGTQINKIYCHHEFEKPIKVRDEKLLQKNKWQQKREHKNKIYRYYYALEHISQGERYIEMREGDILTECKACGWKRDSANKNRRIR